MIVGLQQGMSLVSVRSQLGEPLSESNASGEAALQYKGWLLLFHNNNLERRIRQHWPHHPITRSLKGMLDAKVLALHRGVSVRSVRADLGAPDSYEEVFEATRRPELILRYGPWEVAFVDGKLNRRTNQ
jgi:hypothetical protein